MVLITLGISCVAALALSLAVYTAFGSILLAVLAYAITGTLLLFAALFVALLREQSELTEASDPLLFPAE